MSMMIACNTSEEEGVVFEYTTTAPNQIVTSIIVPEAVTIDWGDGNTVTDAGSKATHTFADAGKHEVIYTGNITSFQNDATTGKYLTRMVSDGNKQWDNGYKAFYECFELIGIPDSVDTSNVTTMSLMFYGATAFNQSVSNFDTSNVTTMTQMFRNATEFNQPVSNFDTSKVTNMSLMFRNAKVFNQPVSNFDTSNVTNMSGMFSNTTAFNQPVSNFDTSNVTTMSQMFYDATAFNQPVSNFDTSKVTNMFQMFYDATEFNQPVSNFDTSNVTTMSSMFRNATEFNQPVSNFDTSNVTTMSLMFYNAKVFNQSVSNFDTSNVTDMSYMFYGATALRNLNMNSWNIGKVTTMDSMLKGTTDAMTTADYDATLIAWNNQPHQQNVKVHFGGAKYTLGSDAETARDGLIADGWVIVDSGGV